MEGWRDGGMEEEGGVGVVMDNRDTGETDTLCWTDEER